MTNRSRQFASAGLLTLAVGVAMALDPAEAFSAADGFLDRLSGKWVGSGVVRRAPTMPREVVKCRLTGRAGSNTSLVLDYVCLGVDVKFQTSGKLVYDDERKVYTGSWSTGGKLKNARAEGRRKGNVLHMRVTGTDSETGKTVHSRFTVTLAGKTSMRNTFTTTDPKTGKRYQAFSATFKR